MDLQFEMHNCSCGRTFGSRGGLTAHESTCRQTKKRLANALEDAREMLMDYKRQRRDALETFIPKSAPMNSSSNSNAGVAWPGSEPVTNMPVSLIHFCNFNLVVVLS